MRSSNRVYVQLFHELNIFHYIGKRNRRTGLAVEVVTVNTFEFNSVAVDFEYFIFNGYLSKPYFINNQFPFRF